MNIIDAVVFISVLISVFSFGVGTFFKKIATNGNYSRSQGRLLIYMLLSFALSGITAAIAVITFRI